MRVRKRALTFIILSIIAITYIIRVVVVNKDAERTPVVIYNVGEVVDFGTDYIDNADEAIPDMPYRYWVMNWSTQKNSMTDTIWAR